MRKSALLIAGTALVLASCKKETIDYTKDNNPYNKTGILPLSNDNRWYYKWTVYANDGQPDFTMDDSMTCSNIGYGTSVYYFPGPILQGAYNNRDAYALQLAGDPDYFKAVSQDEVLNDKVENGYRHINIAFAGPQKVNGYDTYKNLSLSINEITGDTVIEQYFYFAKGVGIVRLENMKLNGPRRLGETYDLTSYIVR